MSIRLDKEVIWEWYKKIVDQKKSLVAATKYCEINNLDYKFFSKMRYRIIYRRDSSPKVYKNLMLLGKEHLETRHLKSAEKFAKENNISPENLREVVIHIRYLEVISSMQEEKEGQDMKFVHVQHQGMLQQPAQAPEIIESRNDIEIVIAQGVKVTISPNIDSMKIIKIIELLKDL